MSLRRGTRYWTIPMPSILARSLFGMSFTLKVAIVPRRSGLSFNLKSMTLVMRSHLGESTQSDIGFLLRRREWIRHLDLILLGLLHERGEDLVVDRELAVAVFGHMPKPLSSVV